MAATLRLFYFIHPHCLTSGGTPGLLPDTRAQSQQHGRALWESDYAHLSSFLTLSQTVACLGTVNKTARS